MKNIIITGGVALFLQVTPNSGAHESVVPCYINFG